MFVLSDVLRKTGRVIMGSQK